MDVWQFFPVVMAVPPTATPVWQVGGVVQGAAARRLRCAPGCFVSIGLAVVGRNGTLVVMVAVFALSFIYASVVLISQRILQDASAVDGQISGFDVVDGSVRIYWSRPSRSTSARNCVAPRGAGVIGLSPCGPLQRWRLLRRCLREVVWPCQLEVMWTFC